MKKALLILTIIISSITASFASHIPGGNLTWTCTGVPNQYIVTMQLFVSCPSTLGTSYTGTITNTCGLPNPTLVMPQVGMMQEVSQICQDQMWNSACATPAGTIPGVRMYTYQTTVTLPAGCNTWDFAFSLCCRDASTNTNGGSGNTMYFHSGMNSITAPCDNSPVVTAAPIPYVCAGVQQTYCPGAIDPDGDSLFYSLVNPLNANAVPITHPAPYSPTQPLQNLVFDPLTGCLTFNQPTIGNFVVTYLIQAYDANGNLTGFIYHDFQFEVINNTNCQPPQGPAGGLTNLTGNATLLNPNTIQVCEGQTICFDVTFSDPDLGDTLTLDSNNTNIWAALPGVTVTPSGINPVTFTICWTVPVGASPNTQFTIGVSDGSCPIENLASYPIAINVVNSTVAPPDMTICGGQVANLSANGGTIFNWSVIAGPPMIVGTNFSCNPCANPVATPTATTTYVVTSNLSGGCDNKDTVTVNVVPDFTPTASQSSATSCLFEPVQLNVGVIPNTPGYGYAWSPATYLSATNIANPIANITVPGVYTYVVTVTSPGGCVKKDSINIVVAAAVAPTIDILTPDSLMACGDSILIDLDLGGGIPAVCGPSATNACSGPTAQTTIGTGTTNISNAPSPYYGFYEDGRVQMIYTAAEINAMGFLGGKITEIAFNITTKASTQPYNGLTIKMGCTSQNDFVTSNVFVTGLTQVYTNPSYTSVAGWNTHVLNTAYEWDGTSNLIVEVCFDNSSWTSTDRVQQTNTTVARTLYDYTDVAVGCTLNTPYTPSVNRPNIRFTQCPTVPNPSAYTYLWTPNVNIITSTMQNPTVFPSQPTTYVVTVTDTAGGCTDTDSITITVLCGTCYPVIPTVTNPTCKDGSDGKIVIDPVFVFGSEMQTFIWKDSISNITLQTTSNVTAGKDSLTGLPAGAYTITMVDSSGCSADTTVWLYEPDSVVINSISSDTIICIGGTTPINATAIGGNSSTYTYTWTDLSTNTVIPGNGPHNVSPIVSPTCYSVMATDSLGCISSDKQVCISLYPNLIASTTKDTHYVCPGFGTNIDMTTIGGSGVGYNYNWYDNGLLIGNGSTINVTPTSAPTTYIGVATDNCTTPADSVSIVVDWFQLVTPSLTRNKPDSCYPITVEFTNTSTPAALIGGTMWSFSDGINMGGNPASRAFNTPGCRDITMTVTTVDGCIVDTTILSYVCPHDYPVAEFSSNPEITDLLNTQVDFNNLSTGLGLSYLWTFNSGLNPDTSTVQDPRFVFPNQIPGQYNVNLTVTNQYGCVTDVTHTIIINGIYMFYVPNTFTPDGDGLNDIFMPYGEGVDLTKYSMQIFDRWGELIYQSPDATKGWNGTYKGKPAPLGTYIWKIDTKEEYAPVYHKNFGHVNLIK
jgi:gliding motility-associated-like protein